MTSRTMRTGGAILLALTLLVFEGCGGGGLYGSGGGSSGSGLVTTIAITPGTSTIAVSGTQAYMATAKLGNGSAVSGVQLVWTSSNPAVATVNSSGLAMGVAAGTATITAAVQYGGTGCTGPYCSSGGGNATTITSNAATLTVTASGMAVGAVVASAAVVPGGTNTMAGMSMMPIGRSVPGVVVSLKDSQSQTVVAMTDGNGRYQLATSGLTGGMLLKATDSQGQILYSFAAGGGVINITPLTDMLVRIWYRTHGTTADAAFANPAAHPVPQAAQLNALNKAVTGLLAKALVSQGLDPANFNLISTPFVDDGAGFGLVLDSVAVVQTNGEILLHDVLGQRETTITFDAVHHTVAFNTVDLSARAAPSDVSLSLP